MPTLTGTIKQTTGDARRVDLVFTPLYSPKIVGGALITRTKPVATTLVSDGTFSVVLVAGEYEVQCGDDKFKVVIPDAAGPFDLEDVIEFLD